jgi:hypothetical protein
VVDYIFPSKKRYQYFKGEGSWLKVVMAHPGAAMSKSSTKWDNIRALSKLGCTNTVEIDTFYANIDGIGDLVGGAEGVEYQFVKLMRRRILEPRVRHAEARMDRVNLSPVPPPCLSQMLTFV